MRGSATSSTIGATELPIAVAVPKGKNAELVARFNAGLAVIRSDGTWQQINERWAGK